MLSVYEVTRIRISKITNANNAGFEWPFLRVSSRFVGNGNERKLAFHYACTKLAHENGKRGGRRGRLRRGKSTHLSNRATPPGIYNQASLLIKEFRNSRNVGGKFKYARRILVVRVVIVLDVVAS